MLEKGRKFVEEQKGQWEHIQWDELLGDLQSKGGQLTDEAKHRFGEALEGMKNIYGEMAQTEGVKNSLSKIKDHTVKFVSAHKDGWDHKAWEKLLEDLNKEGIVLTEQTKKYLGNLVEATQKLYDKG